MFGSLAVWQICHGYHNIGKYYNKSMQYKNLHENSVVETLSHLNGGVVSI